MDRLSALWIRTSLIYLIIGISFGTLVLINKAWTWNSTVWRFLPIHISMMLSGFMIPFILGVAHWILPRTNSPHPRGNPAWIMTAWVLWNVTQVFLIGFLWFGYISGRNIAIVSHVIPAMIFVRQMWPRVVTFKELSKSVV